MIYSASISIKRGNPMADIEDKQLVAEIAALARLDFEDAEIETCATQMRSIIDHFKDLMEIDLEGINPTVQIHPIDLPLHDDRIEPGLTPDDALSISNRRRGNLLSVPRIVNPDASGEGE
jgi:aspartyl-tRNA(Asn)/glutamyl-tRNA(Gln) amidotransferase subunit C